MQESSSVKFAEFVCFLIPVFFELYFLKLILKRRQRKIENESGLGYGFMQKIKKEHPYNFTSIDQKIGLTGLGLVILLSFWNSLGWRSAVAATIFLEATAIVIWELLDYLISEKILKISQAQKELSQSEETSNKKTMIVPIVYSLLVITTIPILLNQAMMVMHAAFQFILPLAIYYILMVPLSRFIVAGVLPAIIVSVSRYLFRIVHCKVSELDEEEKNLYAEAVDNETIMERTTNPEDSNTEINYKPKVNPQIERCGDNFVIEEQVEAENQDSQRMRMQIKNEENQTIEQAAMNEEEDEQKESGNVNEGQGNNQLDEVYVSPEKIRSNDKNEKRSGKSKSSGRSKKSSSGKRHVKLVEKDVDSSPFLEEEGSQKVESELRVFCEIIEEDEEEQYATVITEKSASKKPRRPELDSQNKENMFKAINMDV